MARVVIGVDPHKASNTLVIIDERERVLAQQRFTNDRVGYRSMKLFAHPSGSCMGDRGCSRPDLRALGGGSGRKTDEPTPMRSRLPGCARPDDVTEILRMLTTRRQEVVELRIATVNRCMTCSAS